MESDDETLQQRVAEAQDAAAQARQALSVVGKRTGGSARAQVAELTQQMEESERDQEREQREHEEALGGGATPPAS